MDNQTINIKRFEAEGGKESYGEEDVLSGIDCYIEPLREDLVAFFEIEAAFQAFKAHINGIYDIKVSDQVTDGDSINYKVRNVNKYPNNDIEPYMEVIIYRPI